MGLSDRNYMQARTGAGGTPSGGGLTLMDRLRFWWWRVRRRFFSGASAVVLVLGAGGGVARADEGELASDWLDQAVEVGTEILRDVDVEELQAQYGVMADEWSGFWEETQMALASGSLEDLASLAPYAHEALDWMDALPEMGPLADWMRQRIDYFDVAAAVTPPAVVARVRPPPAKGTQAGRKNMGWLHVPPKRAPGAKPAAKTRPPKTVQEVDYWKGRLGQRQVPADRKVVIPRLKEIFREEGVPADLVWMAETESTLNPAARSPAGAVGLFQFMPATAGRFGLKLSPQDERLVPEKSARAAAQYLKFLNGTFNDWPLAIAAYNAGEGRVGQALKRAGGKTFEDAAPHLPVETQMYVPKVLATISLREGRAFAMR